MSFVLVLWVEFLTNLSLLQQYWFIDNIFIKLIVDYVISCQWSENLCLKFHH